MEVFMSHLLTLFEQHMYLILFLGILLELMAVPISGELLMSYAGYFVYQGKMNYALALLTAFISAGIGITATYWIGRAGGYKIIEKYGKYIHFGPEKYKKTAAWFERSGSKMLVFAYFITGVRHFTGYISGISRMPFPKFVILAYTGAFLWGACFISLGRELGPHWKDFNKFASKYLIFFIIALAVLIVCFWAYRSYKNQIKDFFIRLIKWLIYRLKTIRATEIFLIFLTLVLIGMVILMLGLAQDYLYNDFTQFNKITKYMVDSVVYMSWMKDFLFFQSPYAFGVIIAITIIYIWRKSRNKGLEFLLLLVSILGAKLFHDSIKEIFSYFRSFGFKGEYHSANFPDLNATILIIIYGTCLFLLARHSKKNFMPISALILALVLLLGLAITNIALNNVLPSDLVGGYVYGGVWIFFNFLLFEMLRLVLQK
jgi:membrane protein DedA with SNARE-associated domain